MKMHKFEPKPFFLLFFLSLFILITWANGLFDQFWKAVDESLFFMLNQTLAVNKIWSGIWAFLSVRSADLLTLIIILLFFYFQGILFNKGDRVKGLVGFTTLLFLMLVTREIIDLFVEVYNLNRQSPSLVLEPAIMLSEIHSFNLKDSSPSSFPGDHAAVLFTWFGYCIYYSRNKWSFLVLFFVILFTIPRLIAGAHWFSDVAVGGLAISLITLSIGLYTPLLNKVNSNLLLFLTRLMKQ